MPVLDLSTSNINTAPLRHGLSCNFTDKNRYVEGNAAIELETLARVLDAQVTNREKRILLLYY